MNNALILLQVLTQLTLQTQQIAALLQKTQSEGRKPTDEEMAALVSGDDQAQATLDAAIARAKAEGR